MDWYFSDVGFSSATAHPPPPDLSRHHRNPFTGSHFRVVFRSFSSRFRVDRESNSAQKRLETDRKTTRTWLPVGGGRVGGGVISGGGAVAENLRHFGVLPSAHANWKGRSGTFFPLFSELQTHPKLHSPVWVGSKWHRRQTARGYKFGCVCSCMAGHYAWHPNDQQFRNKRTQLVSLTLVMTAVLTLLKQGCANLGWVWSSLIFKEHKKNKWAIGGSSQKPLFSGVAGKPNQRKISSWTFRRGIPEQKFEIWIVLLFLRKNRIHKNGRNSWTFRFGPFFGLVCWGDSWFLSLSWMFLWSGVRTRVVFKKGGFSRCSPEWKPERGYIRMFRNANRNEGTFAYSPRTKNRNEGTFAKTTPFTKPRLFPLDLKKKPKSSRKHSKMGISANLCSGAFCREEKNWWTFRPRKQIFSPPPLPATPSQPRCPPPCLPSSETPPPLYFSMKSPPLVGLELLLPFPGPETAKKKLKISEASAKKKAYNTTTERASCGELFWTQRRAFQAGGRYRKPIKTKENRSTTEIFPLWPPFLFRQREVPHWSRAVYAFFFPVVGLPQMGV